MQTARVLAPRTISTTSTAASSSSSSSDNVGAADAPPTSHNETRAAPPPLRQEEEAQHRQLALALRQAGVTNTSSFLRRLAPLCLISFLCSSPSPSAPGASFALAGSSSYAAFITCCFAVSSCLVPPSSSHTFSPPEVPQSHPGPLHPPPPPHPQPALWLQPAAPGSLLAALPAVLPSCRRARQVAASLPPRDHKEDARLRSHVDKRELRTLLKGATLSGARLDEVVDNCVLQAVDAATVDCALTFKPRKGHTMDVSSRCGFMLVYQSELHDTGVFKYGELARVALHLLRICVPKQRSRCSRGGGACCGYHKDLKWVDTFLICLYRRVRSDDAAVDCDSAVATMLARLRCEDYKPWILDALLVDSRSWEAHRRAAMLVQVALIGVVLNVKLSAVVGALADVQRLRHRSPVSYATPAQVQRLQATVAAMFAPDTGTGTLARAAHSHVAAAGVHSLSVRGGAVAV